MTHSPPSGQNPTVAPAPTPSVPKLRCFLLDFRFDHAENIRCTIGVIQTNQYLAVEELFERYPDACHVEVHSSFEIRDANVHVRQPSQRRLF